LHRGYGHSKRSKRIGIETGNVTEIEIEIGIGSAPESAFRTSTDVTANAIV